MTHKERVLAALNMEPVDLLPCHDTLWTETREKYIASGQLGDEEDVVKHFDTSLYSGGWFNAEADLDFGSIIIEETKEHKLILNGNGAKLRWWKHQTGTPEHVDFEVKERIVWEEKIKPHLLKVDRRRIPFEEYRHQKQLAEEHKCAFCWHGVAPFELMHPVCGH